MLGQGCGWGNVEAGLRAYFNVNATYFDNANVLHELS